ncbi:MAG: IS200/IS605 family transposase [Chloroflexi bacterium]|nr:IS200/IS605 family transposase [Chloroflexota bacterium]
MSRKKFSLYLHLVWVTWDRELWITPDIERIVYRVIVSQIHETGCRIMAINGLPDHVHVMIKLATTISIAELVKKIKGVSARIINQNSLIDDHFMWGVGYGAFTVSRWDTAKILNYIRNQKEHHKKGYSIEYLEEIQF